MTTHLKAEPTAQRPIYFCAPDAEGCIKAPNTQSVFMALWSLRYNSAAVRISGKALGPVLSDLNEADALWWVETRLFDHGLLKAERLERYVRAKAERVVELARAA